jgi:hypothetical protein
MKPILNQVAMRLAVAYLFIMMEPQKMKKNGKAKTLSALK